MTEVAPLTGVQRAAVLLLSGAVAIGAGWVLALGTEARAGASSSEKSRSRSRSRSGGAMAMALDDVPPFRIMMIGRWSSDAFLRYIRKQVEEFNHEVSQKMLTHMFHRNIPDYSSPTVSHLD